MRRLFFLLSFFLLSALNLAAEILDTDNDHLRDEIAFLTDSLCGGRATGSPGCQNAAFFLLRTGSRQICWFFRSCLLPVIPVRTCFSRMRCIREHWKV